MHRLVTLSILLGLAVPAVAWADAATGFDAPLPALDLAQHDRSVVAGLAPGEDLAIAGKRAATACKADTARYNPCQSATPGNTLSLLNGHAVASGTNGVGAGALAAGFFAVESAASLLDGN